MTISFIYQLLIQIISFFFFFNSSVLWEAEDFLHHLTYL